MTPENDKVATLLSSPACLPRTPGSFSHLGFDSSCSFWWCILSYQPPDCDFKQVNLTSPDHRLLLCDAGLRQMILKVPSFQLGNHLSMKFKYEFQHHLSLQDGKQRMRGWLWLIICKWGLGKIDVFAQKKNKLGCKVWKVYPLWNYGFSKRKKLRTLGVIAWLEAEKVFVVPARTRKSSETGASVLPAPSKMRTVASPGSRGRGLPVPLLAIWVNLLTLRLTLHPAVIPFVLLAHILLVQAKGRLSFAKNTRSHGIGSK